MLVPFDNEWSLVNRETAIVNRQSAMRYAWPHTSGSSYFLILTSYFFPTRYSPLATRSPCYGRYNADHRITSHHRIALFQITNVVISYKDIYKRTDLPIIIQQVFSCLSEFFSCRAATTK
jgi:hypothetical protein